MEQLVLSTLKKRKISVTDFAKKIGLTRTTFYNYIKSANPDRDFVKKIENELGVDFTTVNTNDQLNEPEVAYQRRGRGVPYFDIDVTAGNLEIFKGESTEMPTDYFYIPAFSDCTAYVNVRGDSMYSKYCAGDIIAIKQINDRDVIQFGEAYVIITKEQNLFKYIRRHNDDDKWLLESEYKDRYDAFPIKKEKILNVFLVRGILRQKTM